MLNGPEQNTDNPRHEDNNFLKYGYGSEQKELGDRLENVLSSGSINVVTETSHIYGQRLTAYIVGLTNTKTLNEWISGIRSPSQEDLIRLGIALDFAYAIKDEHETEQVASALLMREKPQFNDVSMARALRTVKPQDLMLTHSAFMQIVEDIRLGLGYSARKVYPGMEKYFPEPQDPALHHILAAHNPKN